MKIRWVIIWSAAALILLFVNGQAWQRERLLVTGEPVLLRLVPVDPRSLIQGDFMRLRYNLSTQVEDATELDRGYAIVALDENRVARLTHVSPHRQDGLAVDQAQLRFWRVDGRVKLGPDAYFFQEGQADLYNEAVYVLARVSAAGEVAIAGLLNEDFERLGPTQP